MAPNGNNNEWTKWLVGTLWGVLVTVILFMGNVVNANDKIHSKKYDDMGVKVQKVEKDSIDRDMTIKDCLSDMKNEIVQRLTRIETKVERIGQ